MAEAKNTVTKKYATGKGELTGYVGILAPSKKYDNYTAQLLISKEEGEKLYAVIKDIRQEQFKLYGKGTRLEEITQCIPYTTVDEETGEKIPDNEGRYILKASAKANSENGIPKYRITVLDAKLKPVKNINAGQGTTAKLGVELSGYCAGGKTGVSVRLKLVQIINLVEYQSDTAAAYGLTEEEGFEFEEEEHNSDELAEEEDF